jgi:GT2 family glycosyltransferase
MDLRSSFPSRFERRRRATARRPTLPATPAEGQYPSLTIVRDEPDPAPRPTVRGKFLFAGDTKLVVRGVTYGTFRPDEDGNEFPARATVHRDFAAMAAHGINTVRTYTVPPRWLLDLAQRHGLRVLVGLPVERYIGYLADRDKDAPDVTAIVQAGVAQVAGHPAVLAYSVGNEIPAASARWHGARPVERYLERLCRTVKAVDPAALVTYANYPSTEYLHLPFLDFLCFNVFLESPDRLAAYLARLQTLAGDRPLVMGELGLDGRGHGEQRQAEVLDWQVRVAFAAGCAGAFIYSWTDDWHRGGEDVYDWGFGLTRRDREPKPALEAVRRAFGATPFPDDVEWPRISVVVCTYNGARTLRECLAGLAALDYPDYEVIVIDDGSTDASAAIARQFPCRLVSTENRGLSRARNTGLELATGSIVAYIDDDAYPDPHWLRYLATTFRHSAHAGVGGPNLQPPGDGWIAECVASAPGNPVHILVSDHEAEHVPGCNMAFRKAALEAIGGFDPQFRVAGDDVDLCWRLTDAGFTLGFSPAAVVWHHRRNSLRAFWRQQRGYGRAEGMLQRKWPERHDADGHVAWAGRIYGRGIVRALTWGRGRVYHGIWGTAPFQSLYEPATGLWGAIAQTPVLYLFIAGLGLFSLLGLDWEPLLGALVPLAVGLGLVVAQAGRGAVGATFITPPASPWDELRRRLVVGALHATQPIGRLWSRLSYGLSHRQPWGPSALADLRPITAAQWTDAWRDPADRLRDVETALRQEGGIIRRGGDFDRWDLELRWSGFGAARVLMAVEEHGGGHQLVRLRAWPAVALRGPLLLLLFGGLAAGAAEEGAIVSAVVLAGVAAYFTFRAVAAVAAAAAAVRRALARLGLGSS